MEPESVKSYDDVILLLRAMKEEIEKRPEKWAHTTLQGYFDSMAAWLEDSKGSEQVAHLDSLGATTWQSIADMLTAPKFYE